MSFFFIKKFILLFFLYIFFFYFLLVYRLFPINVALRRFSYRFDRIETTLLRNPARIIQGSVIIRNFGGETQNGIGRDIRGRRVRMTIEFLG